MRIVQALVVLPDMVEASVFLGIRKEALAGREVYSARSLT